MKRDNRNWSLSDAIVVTLIFLGVVTAIVELSFASFSMPLNSGFGEVEL